MALNHSNLLDSYFESEKLCRGQDTFTECQSVDIPNLETQVNERENSDKNHGNKSGEKEPNFKIEFYYKVSYAFESSVAEDSFDLITKTMSHTKSETMTKNRRVTMTKKAMGYGTLQI